MDEQQKICVFEAGYIGLTIAVCLSKYYKIICIDTDELKINDLKII